jgi:hypothetical protein
VTVANKISVIIDVAVDKGVSSLKKFRSAIGEAEGAFGKMKAAGGVAFDSVKANAANFAMAAGAALVTFGVKSVQAFQDTALAAGKFSDATGLAVDEASRMIEVAGDLAVDAGAVETALGKMNKTLGTSPQLFTDLGVEIAKTDTGATDVNGTFLNVVDRLNAIKDPAERARVASQLLGKGWQSMAELIGQGSAGLKESLASVSDAQVIDADELKKAREFRDRMDELNDKLQAVMMTVGEEIVPVLSDMADKASWVTDKFSAVSGAIEDVTGSGLLEWADRLANPFSAIGDAWDGLFGDDDVDKVEAVSTAIEYGTDAADEMARVYGQRVTPTVDDSTYAFDDAAESANLLAIKAGIVERAAESLGAEWDRLKGRIDDKAAWLNMQTTFDDIRDKGAAAMQAAADGADNAEQAMRDYQLGLLGAAGDVVALGKELGLLPDEVSVLVDLAENGQIDELERRLTILTRNREVNLDIIARGGAGYGDRLGGARANGGPVTAGTPYLVGERGPEIVVPGRSGTVIPNNRIGVGGGGMVINITTGADPQAVVAAIKKFEKSNGSGWRS